MAFAIYSNPITLPSNVLLKNEMDDDYELDTSVRYPPLINSSDITYLDRSPSDSFTMKCMSDTGVYFISSSGIWTANAYRWASNVLDESADNFLGNGGAYDNNSGVYVQSDSTTLLNLLGQEETVMGDYLTITFPNEEKFHGYYLNGVGKKSVVCYFNETLNKWVEFSTVITNQPLVPITVTTFEDIASSKNWRIITNTIHPPSNNAAQIYNWWFYKKKPKINFEMRVNSIECENSNNNIMNSNVVNAGLVNGFCGRFSNGVSSANIVSPLIVGSGSFYDFNLAFNDGVYIVSIISSNKGVDGPNIAELDFAASYCGILSVAAYHTQFLLTQLQKAEPAGATLTIAIVGNAIRVTTTSGPLAGYGNAPTDPPTYVYRLSALLIL
jgi:hypothetical protein